MKRQLVQKTVNELIPRIGTDAVAETDKEALSDELGAVQGLPELSPEQAVTEVIKLILEWSMAIALIAIIVAAIYYIIGRGKEDDITKAKDILFYLVIGMALMAAAYGIISGIAQFEIFDGSSSSASQATTTAPATTTP